MTKRYATLAAASILTGAIVRYAGIVALIRRHGNEITPWIIVPAIIGNLLVLAGFALYVKSKGRNLAWALLGFFNELIGICVLMYLTDRSGDRWNT